MYEMSWIGMAASAFVAGKMVLKWCNDSLSLALGAQMILDGKLAGTLDAGEGCLEVFQEAAQGGVYASALDTLRHVGAAIDTLAARSQRVAA